MNNHSYSQVEYELQKLGLKEKEVQIYLACLKLEKPTIVRISSLTGLSRPTIYRTLEVLKQKDLVEEISVNHNKGIKAKSPDQLLALLRIQKRKIEEQEREFIRVISLLKNEYLFGEKNKITAYEGSAGKKIILDDFSYTSSKKILIAYFNSKNDQKSEIEKILKKINKRVGQVQVKIWQTTETRESGEIELVIITDRVYVLTKNESIVLANESLLKLAKIIFNFATQP